MSGSTTVNRPKKIENESHLDSIVKNTKEISIVVVRRSADKNVMFYRNNEDEEFQVKMSPYPFQNFQEAEEYYNYDSYEVKMSIARVILKPLSAKKQKTVKKSNYKKFNNYPKP